MLELFLNGVDASTTSKVAYIAHVFPIMILLISTTFLLFGVLLSWMIRSPIQILNGKIPRPK